MEKHLFRILLLLALLFFGCDTNTSGERNGEQQAGTAVTGNSDPLNGMQEYHDKEGNLIMRGEKVNGRREGGWESYFPDGRLRSKGTFMNGKREGPTTVYHENGNIYYTGWYKNDVPVREWTFNDRDGKPVKLVRYTDDGVLIEEKEL